MDHDTPPAAPETAGFDPDRPDYRNSPVSPRRPARTWRPADPGAAPAVSIVTPYFDAPELFHETVRSVLGQTLQQWEWILVDDGSTDPGALARLAACAGADPRVRVVRHPRNRGLSAARNTGFREARAGLVFQLDADDLIEPTALEKLAWHLATTPAAAFAGGFTVGFGSKEYVWRHGFHDGPAFLEENQVTATKLVRRSVHREVGGYDEANRAGLEDWAFWLAAADRGHWGTTIEEVVDWYRRRDTGREHWANVQQAERTRAFRDALRGRHPRLLERFPALAPLSRPFVSLAEPPLPFANRLAPGPRRLLFVVPHFELGGADKFNLDAIRALQRDHGWEVTVVATRTCPHPWEAAFTALTPDVFALSRFLDPADHPRFLRYLVESRGPAAVLLSNSLAGYQLAPYLRAHFPELPLVDYLHMEEEGYGGGGYPRCSVEVASQLSATLVSSRHLARWMADRGRDPGEVEVIYTGIDADRWTRSEAAATAAAARHGVDRSRPVILHAARLCDQKQPRVLAEVLKRVARVEPGFTALIAGDGPDRDWLAAFVEREGLSQVKLLGSVPNDAMPGLLSLADVFFLPSKWEGIALAVYEAMAMEVVPLTADVGGQAELVVPGTGLLVRPGPGQVDDYAAALLTLLRDPAGRARLARAARARVAEQFPIAAMGRQLDAALRGAGARAGRLERPPLPVAWAPLVGWLAAEQARATLSADHQYRQVEAARREVDEAVGWLGPAAAARLLAQRGLRAEALAAYDQAAEAVARVAEAAREVEARQRLARELIPLDPLRAAAVLEGGQSRVASPVARRMTDELIARLRAAVGSTATPAPTLTATSTPPATATAGPPEVTVVIPCYRQAHFLPEAVASVAAQTFAAWEIVVVDDGSPDDTAEVAGRLADRHGAGRVRLIRQENRGLPAARNAGFRAARGRYVLPLDADDRIKPPLLARLVEVLERRPEVGFAYTEIEHFGARDDVYRLPDFDREALYRGNIACVCALVRRAAWEQVGGYDEAMREGYEDWDFWITLARAGWDGHCTHAPLFLYRKSSEGLLREANRKQDRLLAGIIAKHAPLFDERTRGWAAEELARHRA